MFSIVIPLYNKAHTIVKTISSVLNQTFGNYEIIVVNDGSTDNGVEIINKTFSDVRIKIFNQCNMGVSSARNKGVIESIYNYIAFLDGDDEWLPDFLLKILEAIQLFPNAGFYGTSSFHFDIESENKYDATLNRYKYRITKVNYFENPHTMSHTSATVVNKEFILKIDKKDFFPVELRRCEDFSCFYRLAMISDYIYIGFPLSIRNNNVIGQLTSVTGNQKHEFVTDIASFYNIVYDFWLNHNKTKNDTYLIFTKYELRCSIIAALRDSDYKTIDILFKNLNLGVLSLLSKFERLIYPQKKMKVISYLFIYVTKIIWRFHGYPITGKN